MDKSRDKILNKLREATANWSKETVQNSLDNAAIFDPAPENLLPLFEQKLTVLGANYISCKQQADLPNQLQQLIISKGWGNVQCNESAIRQFLPTAIDTIDKNNHQVLQAAVSITSCQALIARTGTILVDSSTTAGRRLSIVSPVHIVVAYRHQLVYDLKDALTSYTNQNIPSMLCLISGNSKTADIEKTLVNGAHGPKELYVVVVN